MSTYRRGHGRLRRRIGAALACSLLIVVALPATGAGARAPMQTIVQDDAALLHRSDEDVAANMRRLRSLGVDRVRITAGWSVLAPQADSPTKPDFDAADPNAYPDPTGQWAALDRGVREAHAAGLEVMIDIAFWAPLWATQGDPNQGRARWNISADEYALFTKAVVKRYSGNFTPQPEQEPQPEQQQEQQEQSRDESFLEQIFGGWSGGEEPEQQQQEPEQSEPPAQPLPRVSWWTIWNEPNHPGFVQPQWKRVGDELVPNSPHIYRRLVKTAYPAIKGLQPDSVVLVGGLSSTGPREPKGETSGMAPLRFLRTLACVDAQFDPIESGDCAGFEPILGDGFSHHPYSLMRRPDDGDLRNPDNAGIGALDRLTDTLDRLVKMGRLDPKLRDVYLTEFGYESNPPDPVKPWSPAQQARFLNWSEYLAWRNPSVRSYPQFLLYDMDRMSAEQQAATGKREFGDWQSGLFFIDGTPKPAATSFKLALHAECVTVRVRTSRKSSRSRRSRSSRRRARYSRQKLVMVWGHIRPSEGREEVKLTMRRRGDWQAAATASSRSRLARSRARGGRGRVASTVPFETDGAGVFRRYAPYVRGADYRLERTDGSGEASLTVDPVGCGGSRYSRSERTSSRVASSRSYRG